MAPPPRRVQQVSCMPRQFRTIKVPTNAHLIIEVLTPPDVGYPLRLHIGVIPASSLVAAPPL